MRDSKGHKKILEYELADAEKLNSQLESPYEVQYEKSKDVEFLMRSYKYSNCHFQLFRVNEYE